MLKSFLDIRQIYNLRKKNDLEILWTRETELDKQRRRCQKRIIIKSRSLEKDEEKKIKRLS